MKEGVVIGGVGKNFVRAGKRQERDPCDRRKYCYRGRTEGTTRRCESYVCRGRSTKKNPALRKTPSVKRGGGRLLRLGPERGKKSEEGRNEKALLDRTSVKVLCKRKAPHEGQTHEKTSVCKRCFNQFGQEKKNKVPLLSLGKDKTLAFSLPEKEFFWGKKEGCLAKRWKRGRFWGNVAIAQKGTDLYEKRKSLYKKVGNDTDWRKEA